ncbi:MAG: chemotaxis protein CheW [Bacteroidetes bacterium]|nr:chemotaxis protein CheW [Bacteroidota bacterium]
MNLDKPLKQLLYISTKQHRFCLPVDEVERLLLLMEIQKIPKAPDYLVGLMNLHGKAVPVIDLAMRFGIQHEGHYTVQTPVVLVSCNQQKCALIIDDIEGVDKVSNKHIRAENLFTGGPHLVKASVITNTKTALLLDTKCIIDIDLDTAGIPLFLEDELLSLCKIQGTNDE